MNNEQIPAQPFVITEDFTNQMRAVNAALMLNLPHKFISNLAERVNPWGDFGFNNMSTPLGCLMIGVEGWPNRDGWLSHERRCVYFVRMPNGRSIALHANTEDQMVALEYLIKLSEAARR